jgi:predicted hotdog family 3-hydroxylacyl-ACP dehydratase
MRLNRDWIESHIPHSGRMCLLDEVLEWQSDEIRCASGGHRAADHPLRAHARLGIACGIEIAAQTMAVRGVRMYAARLDDAEADVICRATRVAGDEGTALYEFELTSAGALLLQGRATVVLDAADRWSK